MGFPPCSITVGIIGGGVIGGVVAHALLDAGIPPPAVLMSTRSPLRQKDLAARGVAVVFDNALVAARCQLLILCVLPAQLQDVAKTLRPQSHTVVLSLVGARWVRRRSPRFARSSTRRTHYPLAPTTRSRC